MKKLSVLVLVCCSFVFSGLVFAQSSVEVFKTYLTEKKDAKSQDEAMKVEEKYRIEGYSEGLEVPFINVTQWRDAQKGPDQIDITGSQEDGDMATIEYKTKEDDYSYGEATLLKEGGVWKIQEYGLIDFNSDYN
ncbi:MAG: hypothetical protein ABIC68_08285 [Candidatus Omnitrophota bacterium]